tara:strand:- start:971 stop:1411 length:441 start_codon:yes stop_codon:yes gene_type:complete
VKKTVLAIDPGKNGGMAFCSEGEVSLRKFTTEGELTDFILSLPNETVAVVEDVPKFVSAQTSSSSSFKLGYNYGYYLGALRTRRISTNLVKPQVWQKGLVGLRPKMGYTDRKRCLKDNAQRLYPNLKITHATADALLILHWFLSSS